MRSIAAITLADVKDIERRLSLDRPWAAFSLADLAPRHRPYASWFGPPSGDSVVLVYAAYDPPIVICHGPDAECEATLRGDEVASRTPSVYLNVRHQQLSIATAVFRHFDARPMVRMLLHLEPPLSDRSDGRVVRLGPADLPELQALYADEPPEFFLPDQLHDGVYYGCRDNGELVTVAGTHVVADAFAVGAVGNVYTRRLHRGRGLATACTNAVVRELVGRGLTTIVLNIVAANETARRVYERIGFREYVRYFEGVARR